MVKYKSMCIIGNLNKKSGSEKMDMYQKRKNRQEMKSNENKDEMQNKMNINWYPGHMAKTRRQIIEDLKLIDVVVELLDARIPISSRNPDIREITKNKKKIILLNKSDLSDDSVNTKWVSYFSKEAKTILTEVAYELLKKLYEEYIENLKQRYKLTDEEIENVKSEEENFIYGLMKLIARKRGALVSGGEVDDEKVSGIIIDDFRTGKLGKISLERP